MATKTEVTDVRIPFEFEHQHVDDSLQEDMAAVVAFRFLPVEINPTGEIIDKGMGLPVQEGMGGETENIGSDQGQILTAFRLQVPQLANHVGDQPSVSLAVGVYPELETRRLGSLIVVKIGPLSPEAEDVAVLPKDIFRIVSQGFQERVFCKHQMTDL